MKHGLTRGDKDIGRERIATREDNKEAVFNAIRGISTNNPKKTRVRLEDIENELEESTKWQNELIEIKIRETYEKADKNWTRQEMNKALEEEKVTTITRRTIQSCIKSDARIKKDGWYFYIDDEARFENRYLIPEQFGRILYRAVEDELGERNMSKYYQYAKGYVKRPKEELLKMRMKDDVELFGTFFVYSIIEASRPFKDKSMSNTEREDLVRYWIKNSIPIDEISETFKAHFDPKFSEYDRNKVEGEMDDEAIQNAISILEECYPQMTKILKEKFNSVTYHAVRKRGKIDHWVRGKSYHKTVPPIPPEEEWWNKPNYTPLGL